MATKSAIRDVARVLDLPYSADKIAEIDSGNDAFQMEFASFF
jgi:DNA polymerase III alpha subunit